MSKPSYPSDAAARFLVRMPEGMRDQIAAAAERNGRSMNAEVVSRLQASFGHVEQPFTENQQKVVEIMINQYFDEDRKAMEARFAKMEAEHEALYKELEERVRKAVKLD